ncbi:MAG: phospholipid carrier-dependent glycosyltransferase [Chloroflexota bacterium]|nr:MAG: phospholipid carrier-dependent glycosyltransferase [Chloroflexota bacterium]
MRTVSAQKHATLSLPLGDFRLILSVALLLRLAFVLLTVPNVSGGDTLGLLQYGLELVRDQMPYMTPIAPLYLLYTGIVQSLFGEGNLVPFRLLNVLWSLALVMAVFAAAEAYFSRRTAVIAAWLIALNPIFIIESGQILTESVFLPFMVGALALHGRFTQQGKGMTWPQAASVGALLGLASLTRAVALVLPSIFVVHLLWRYRRGAWRLIAALLIGYSAVVLSWTVYGLLRWQTFMIGGSGFAANLYLGTNEGWCGPQCLDERAGITAEDQFRNDEIYAQRALEAIASDPRGYILRRAANLLEASLQPHNTVFFQGESLRELFMVWWQTDRSLAGLGQVLGGDAFLPKLSLYIFHFGTLWLGAFGMLLGALRWRVFWRNLPLYGAVMYFYALHSLLTAIPRYLFPTAALWLIFASAALAGRAALEKQDEKAA